MKLAVQNKIIHWGKEKKKIRKREREGWSGWTWKHALLVWGGAVVWGGGSIGFAEKAEPRACAVVWSHRAERNWQRSEGEN